MVHLRLGKFCLCIQCSCNVCPHSIQQPFRSIVFLLLRQHECHRAVHSFHFCERIRRLRFRPQVFFNGIQYRWLHLHVSHVYNFIIIRQKFSSRASDSGECLLRCSSLCAHAYASFVTCVNRRLICFLQCLYSVSCRISRRCFGCRFCRKIGASRASLPPLISSHAVLQSVQQNVQSRISNTGYITGYAGGIIMTLIAVAVAFLGAAASSATQREKDNAGNRSGRIVLLIVGIWWFCFSLYTFYRLGPHPGPSLPSMKHYIILPWTRLFQTFRHIRELPTLSRYLVLYFVYSDGFNVIGSVRNSALPVFVHLSASEMLTCSCSWACSLR